LLSDAYMEQWRLAMGQENYPLAENARREVIRYEGGEPNRYSGELNGSATVMLTLDPENARGYLFKYVPIDGRYAGEMETRLVPVPYDLANLDVFPDALNAENTRARNGPAVLPGAHSIFNLAPLQSAMVPFKTVHNLHLPPGTYLLLAQVTGRED